MFKSGVQVRSNGVFPKAAVQSSRARETASNAALNGIPEPAAARIRCARAHAAGTLDLAWRSKPDRLRLGVLTILQWLV